MLKQNVGQLDKIVRIIAGLALLAIAFMTLNGALAWVAGIVGVVLLATGFTGTCPAYSVTGINTKGRGEAV